MQFFAEKRPKPDAGLLRPELADAGATVQVRSGSAHQVSHVVRPPGKTRIELTYGHVVFTPRARKAVLTGGALLPGGDNAHIAISEDGRLGYDRNHLGPEDPFRWEKVKFLVDSGAKVRIDLVSLTDSIDTVAVDEAGTVRKIPTTLRHFAAAGVTLPTVEVQRAGKPAGELVAAPGDVNLVYFSALFGEASTGPLSHELFGHLYLALRGVPFGHGSVLDRQHGITDPLGGNYAGTVDDYLRQYVDSQSFSGFASPTQFVGLGHLRAAMQAFRDDLPTRATGKLNEDWAVPAPLDTAWGVVSANYAVAKVADPKVQASIEDELAAWYATLTVDQQYVVLKYLGKVVETRLGRATELAAALRTRLKPPPEMR